MGWASREPRAIPRDDQPIRRLREHPKPGSSFENSTRGMQLVLLTGNVAVRTGSSPIGRLAGGSNSGIEVITPVSGGTRKGLFRLNRHEPCSQYTESAGYGADSD